MSTENERKQILSMIESGKISPGQGVKLLQALDDIFIEDRPGGESLAQAAEEGAKPSEPVEAAPGDLENPAPPAPAADQALALPPAIPASAGEENGQSAAEVSPPPDPVERPDFARWRRWMMIPLWSGVLITVLGGVLMYAAWMAARGFSFWFACAWLPFLFGIALMVLSWGGRSVRWLHIRIQQRAGEWPQKIEFSIPLPLLLMAWVVRIFGGRLNDVKGKGIEEMILALKKTSPEAPYYLDVDEGEDGDRVEVFIG